MRKLIIFLYNINITLFKRLVPSLLRRIFFIGKTQVIDLNFCKIVLNLKNSIDREIYLKGYYEKEQIDFLKKVSKKENIEYFLDVGSYIGYYSLCFMNIKNIYAFEPNIKNFQQLEKNFKLNNINGFIYNVACSNMSEEKKIWYTNKNKMGGSAIYKKNDPELKKYDKNKIIFENIQTKRLDEMVKIEGKNLIIKIDVERHELDVLKGSCDNILNKNKVIMQIEVQNDLKNKVFSFLESNSFKKIHSIGHDFYFKNF